MEGSKTLLLVELGRCFTIARHNLLEELLRMKETGMTVVNFVENT